MSDSETPRSGTEYTESEYDSATSRSEITESTIPESQLNTPLSTERTEPVKGNRLNSKLTQKSRVGPPPTYISKITEEIIPEPENEDDLLSHLKVRNPRYCGCVVSVCV